LTNAGRFGIIKHGGGKMDREYIAEARAKIGTESFPLTLNEGHQTKHIAGSHNFDPLRGTLTVDPKELIRIHAGKGIPRPRISGAWNQKEWFEHTSEIGVWRDSETGEEAPTNKGMLHYAKLGVHIVPCNPKGEYK
jgi:hypothetical protein